MITIALTDWSGTFHHPPTFRTDPELSSGLIAPCQVQCNFSASELSLKNVTFHPGARRWDTVSRFKNHLKSRSFINLFKLHWNSWIGGGAGAGLVTGLVILGWLDTRCIVSEAGTMGARDDMWWWGWIMLISGKQWSGAGNTRKQGQSLDGRGLWDSIRGQYLGHVITLDQSDGRGLGQKLFEAGRRYELDITPGLPQIRWFIELLCQQKTGVKWVSFDSVQILIQMMGRTSGRRALLDD